ncbi:FAD binding domain-containing protein [Dongia soli]|uniref:FAD binding domain-containing protein n=1 Tax=Dongia soli TaxID=600628 RepID=A0ABU5E943_9PROT|nr:FAD binding domain-containing protein [Dongia soli]MDY0882797.1 FAD binding domain-containing protein [Dongia soli]
MKPSLYFRPTNLQEALAALSENSWSVLAGGTDFYPARLGKALDENVLDISAIIGQEKISYTDGQWRLSLQATWSDLMADNRLPARFEGLKHAAREVGGVQIQNRATICGNLCNASPAADGIPNLLALNAQVELMSLQGKRILPIADFLEGNRRTLRRDDELVTALLVPDSGRPARSTFLKLGARKYLVISIVMVGAVLELSDDLRIVTARIAVGACSPVAQRLPLLEQDLIGRQLETSLADVVDERHLAPLAPIDDVRGTAEYRHDAVITLLQRSLMELSR